MSDFKKLRGISDQKLSEALSNHAELINLAKEAIDKMHSQSKMGSLMLCGICQVPDVLDQSTIKFARKR